MKKFKYVYKGKIKDLRKDLIITNLAELLNKNASIYYKKKTEFITKDFIERCYYNDIKELYNVITIYERAIIFNEYGQKRFALVKEIIHNFRLLLELAKENKKVS